MIVNAGSPRHHIDVVVFASPLVRVGRWRCPADHPQFRDSGPSSDALFVFPREGVWIEHEGREPFVADANTVTYYNKGQNYRRRKLSARGDQCEWFAVAQEAIAETLARTSRRRSIGRARRFPSRTGRAIPTATCGSGWCFTTCRARQTGSAVRRGSGAVDSGDVTRLAYQHDARPAADRPRATSI